MYCLNCGAEIPAGSAFCTSCGAKVGGASPAPQSGQPTYDGSSYSQQPYGAYGQPPQDQPPKKGKPKKIWLIAGGAVLLLAIVAVLIFVVFKGGGGWPLSGNTVQTRFVNDAVKVFSGAFSGLGTADTDRMLTEPFDIEMDVSADSNGYSSEASVAVVYDKQTLGAVAEADGSDPQVLLLDEDTLYSSSYGYVSGFRFDADADLSKPMTLKERIAALAQGIGSEYDIEYQKLVEMLLNSINEDCFEKSGDTTTLTLTVDDLVEALDVFSDKLEDDEELSGQLEELISDMSGTSMDASALISMASSMLEAQAGSIDFEFTWEIRYNGNTPAGMEISYDDGTDYGSFTMLFEYEDTSDGRDILLNVTQGSMETKGEISVATEGKETSFDGEIAVYYDGSPYYKYTIEGTASVDGEDVEGSIEVTDDYGTSYSIEYSGTMAFGMPEEMVADDSRFDVDKSGASISDTEDIFSSGMNGYSLPGIDSNWGTATPTESAWPETTAAVSEMPSAAPAYSTGVIGVILPTMDTTYYTTLANDIASEVSYYGWEISVYTTDYMGTEADALYALMSEGVDAVIIDPAGLDDYGVQELESICLATGLPCVLLLDEGETATGSVSAVSLDLTYAGADMAYLCNLGSVYVIGGDEYSNETYYIEQGLLYDSSYGIADYGGIDLMGLTYASDAYPAADIAADVLASYPDMGTFVCTDPDISAELLEALEYMGYTGNLLCYTDETTMGEMSSYAYNTYVTYEYFTITDIAYYCATAVADQVQYGLGTQTYSVTSYNW